MPDRLDVVDDLLPVWRTRRPYRTRAAAWPSKSAEIGDRRVELFDLPALGTTWFARDAAYWARRVGAVVLCLVAIAVVTLLDIGFLKAAARAGQIPVVIPVLVLLFVAGGFFYLRPDLFAKTGTTGVEPLPGPVKAVGLVVAMAALAVTPGWTLGALADLLPRFPVQERAAWDYLVFQLTREQ